MTNVQKLLAALLDPFQDLEDAEQQMYADRGINTAVGAQLDIIGKLVGCAREGITDDEIYRRRIRAAIATNKSDGLVEDMLTIANLIIFDPDAQYVLQNEGIAAFSFEILGIQITDAAVVDTLMKYLRRAVAAGVRIIVELLMEAEDDSFAFAGDGPGKGFSSVLDSSLGGALTHALE